MHFFIAKISGIFFEKVHGASNRLQKLTLSLVNKPYVIACCKVLSILAKIVTGPLWRLIESYKHVLDLTHGYHTLLLYFDKMSEDATAFISGENHPFCAEVMEREKVYNMLIQPDENIDGIACACAQLIFQGLHKLLQKAMKEQLPGGRFYDASANLQQQTQSVIPHNKIPERVFGILDFFLHYRPNYTTITNEVFLMFVFDKTLQWLEFLLDNERE